MELKSRNFLCGERRVDKLGENEATQRLVEANFNSPLTGQMEL